MNDFYSRNLPVLLPLVMLFFCGCATQNNGKVVTCLSTVCQNGDQDDDGVCDDWDRELNTPKGARVDGSGKALDLDFDGIIDLYDACPTFHGRPNSDPKLNGCPVKDVMEDITNDPCIGQESNIEFEKNTADIKPSFFPNLDCIAKIILRYGEGHKFIVEGHTDSRGSDAYNLKISQQRAESVVRYLENKGVPKGQLVPVGKGWEGAMWPECKPADSCEEWKNKQNRRVVFRLVDDSATDTSK